MPRAPRSPRPRMTSVGILASRSISCRSTLPVRKTRRRSRKASPFLTWPWSSSGWGWIRSRRNLPRKSSLPNDGLVHSLSRLASATCFDCSYEGLDVMSENPPPPRRPTTGDGARDRPEAVAIAVPALQYARSPAAPRVRIDVQPCSSGRYRRHRARPLVTGLPGTARTVLRRGPSEIAARGRVEPASARPFQALSCGGHLVAPSRTTNRPSRRRGRPHGRITGRRLDHRRLDRVGDGVPGADHAGRSALRRPVRHRLLRLVDD